MPAPVFADTSQDDPGRSRNPLLVGLLGLAVAFVVFMWIFAFFFASDEGINRIEDRAWAARAEEICAAAKTELVALADFRRLDEVGGDALGQRADIVEKANAILTTMIDDVNSVEPVGERGAKVIPRWIDDWRTYLSDRVTYVAALRSGDGGGFSETEINGSPITNFLGDLARQNEMPSCQAPLDLAN
jgi:hypothetical protein